MKFDEIIDVKHWQNIQDLFSALIGISLKTVDEKGEVIVRPYRIPKICSEIISESAIARKKCWEWYPRAVSGLKNKTDILFSENVCPLGLTNFIIPVNMGNEDNTYLIVGPLVFKDSKKDISFSSRVQEIEVDEQKFFEGFNQLPAVSDTKIRGIIDFLNSIIAFMQRLNSFEGKFDKDNFVFNKETIAALLKIFLDLAMKLCNAERGSVMVFEPNSQYLKINEAQGLPEDVVKNTKLKPGEGLAGLTIQQRKSLFLNDGLSDREVRLRMNKPKIKSAFVIPVFHKKQVLGVISVSTAKSPNRFSDGLMELLNELVGMALEKVCLE